MFDRTTIIAARAPDQHHHHRSEVYEHRAPTDASVKLLGEMEQAAEKKWLHSFRLEGCEVDCIVHHQYLLHLHDEHAFCVQYRLGGARHEVRHNFRPKMSEDAHESRRRLVAELLQAVGESIARELLGPAMNRALNMRNFP